MRLSPARQPLGYRATPGRCGAGVTKKTSCRLLTDMVDGAGAELPEEFLGAESAEVVDRVWPQVQHVVARKAVALFHDDDAGA